MQENFFFFALIFLNNGFLIVIYDCITIANFNK